MHSETSASFLPNAARQFLIPCLLGIAGVALAVWLWSLFCRFPSYAWNDERLAPSVALAQGWSVYPTSHDGVINTWTYGPLPLLFFWPASWAESAAGALQIAAGLNLALALAPIAWICFAKPLGAPTEPARAPASWLHASGAFLLCAALWPEWQYLFHVSDNLAIACGLVGNLLLFRARGGVGLWAAAAAATAALACKQIAIGIPLAQVVWLGLTVGAGAAVRHALRCALIGTALALAAVLIFGAPGLSFTLFKLPAQFGWVADPADRLRDMAWPLALHVLAPAAVMLKWRREFGRGVLLLAALAWLCSLPFGLAGLFKSGGRMNSVHCFALWLPPVLAFLATTATTNSRGQLLRGAIAGAAASLAVCRLGFASERPMRPQIAVYREAEAFVTALRGRIWFPLHPLITLYSERRYYHDEDGLYVRTLARIPLTQHQLWSHLPPAMNVVALQEHLSTWGIARQLIPKTAEPKRAGVWTLWHGQVHAPKP